MRNIRLKLLEDLGRGVAAIYYFMHHMSVDRTLLLAREMNPHIPRKCGCKVIRECEQCQLIDPVPSVHNVEEIQFASN